MYNEQIEQLVNAALADGKLTEKEKMMQIKEGAMDDLLTGRVRLKV